MKYTKQQRMEIGRRIYEKELSVAQAAREYEVGFYTAREYLRMYKAYNPSELSDYTSEGNESVTSEQELKLMDNETYAGFLREQYQNADKDDLINELVNLKLRERSQLL